MARFVIKDDGSNNVEKMIRKFKRKTKELKIIKLFKDRMRYTKPSEKRRIEKMKSKLRHEKRQKLLGGLDDKKVRI